LDKIEIQGFKSIREMSLELNRLNVLIGPNGVGKSNFIGLFKLLNQIVERNLQVYVGQCGGADGLLHFGRKRTRSIRVKLFFESGGFDYECVLAASEDGGLIFRSERDWFQSNGNKWERFKIRDFGYKETELFYQAGSLERLEVQQALEALKSWRVFHFEDTSPEARVKQFCDLHDNRFLRSDASNLAAFLYLLRQKYPDHCRNIVDAIRMVAPFFDDFALEPSALNKEKIRLDWKEKGSDTYFGPAALSDGTLRFICLATLLLQPKLPSTILLDEPELGLHPSALVILADLLRGASTKTQVIASTQSTSLVNQFEPQDIIVAERQDGQSVFKRMGPESMRDWLEDYGLGDLWEKNLIGGRP